MFIIANKNRNHLVYFCAATAALQETTDSSIIGNINLKIDRKLKYISQLKYVFRLEENASRVVGQNSLTTPGEKQHEFSTRT